MSLCGSTTSLASTQVTVQQCTTRLICLSPLLSALVSLHQTIQKLFSDIPNTFLWRRLQLGLLVLKLSFYVQTSQFSYSQPLSSLALASSQLNILTTACRSIGGFHMKLLGRV